MRQGIASLTLDAVAAEAHMDQLRHKSSAVFAALAQNPSLIEPMRAAYSDLHRRIDEDGLTPGVGQAVAAAIDGLWLYWVQGLARVDQDLDGSRPARAREHGRNRALGMNRRAWIGSLLLLGSVVATGGLAAWKYASMRAADAPPANQPEPIESVTIAVARALEHRPTTMSIGDVNALVMEISAGRTVPDSRRVALPCRFPSS